MHCLQLQCAWCCIFHSLFTDSFLQRPFVVMHLPDESIQRRDIEIKITIQLFTSAFLRSTIVQTVRAHGSEALP